MFTLKGLKKKGERNEIRAENEKCKIEWGEN
jgi:hypothetical protein